jgi:uncharacterized protein YbjT (DUF2867 family)
MNVLVTGATGYIGGRIVPRLLARGESVRCFARDSGRLIGRFDGAEIVTGDVFERSDLVRAMHGIDVAYYLIHSMSKSRGDFAESDRIAAKTFGDAALEAGVKRIIYLGGLGDPSKDLSHHLRSRQEVGEILRASGVGVTEFRAAVIVGSGSASFEMMRYLTERLPVMIAPKWVDTRCQPIAIRDVLAYLVGELDQHREGSVIREIGGADKITYKEMMMRYAKIRGLKRTLIVVPYFTPRLSSAWIHLVTPIPSSIARPLVDGLMNEVVVNHDEARREFPTITPLGYDEAIGFALNRYTTVGPETTWFDAVDVRRLPGEFAGLTEGMLIDRRQAHANATPQAVAHVCSQLGGEFGWLYANALWEFRGVLDRIVGGIGLRRGRRSASELRVGDAVDFWRVEAWEPEKLLRLRAEMRLPGNAWLQFEALADEAGGTTLRQTAFFEPRGIFGYLYWYGVMPFHTFIFGNMAKRIAERAGDLEHGQEALAV